MNEARALVEAFDAANKRGEQCALATVVSVGAVVLAAGSSSRMGSPKQTLQFRGKSLLRRAALSALGAGCGPVIVVTGANAELSRRELDGLEVREVLNTHWETGMASSIRAGVEGLVSADPDAAAAVLLLCDQPHVTSNVISSLVAAHRTTGRPVVASTYGGSFGVLATLITKIIESPEKYIRENLGVNKPNS